MGATAVKVNTKQEVKGYDGTTVTEPVEGNKRIPITIAALIRQVMNTPLADEGWTPETLMQCADLSRRALENELATYSEKERTFIQDRAAKVYERFPNGPQFYTALVVALADPPDDEQVVAHDDDPVE